MIVVGKLSEVPNWAPLSSTNGAQVAENIKALFSFFPTKSRLNEFDWDYDKRIRTIERQGISKKEKNDPSPVVGKAKNRKNS